MTSKEIMPLPCARCGRDPEHKDIPNGEHIITWVRCSDESGQCGDSRTWMPLLDWDKRAPAVCRAASAAEPVAYLYECPPGKDLATVYIVHRRRDLVDEGWTEHPVYTAPATEGTQKPVADFAKLRADMKAFADHAYCEGLRIAQTVPCLGWEAKVKDGTYGKTEHQAHRDSDNWDGKHRGAWECIRMLDAFFQEAPTGERGAEGCEHKDTMIIDRRIEWCESCGSIMMVNLETGCRRPNGQWLAPKLAAAQGEK